MFVLLMSIGAAASLLGASLVAIGVPINEFGLGNTLIVAGTTLFTGGLIVIGLAAVVRQLSALSASGMAMPSTPPGMATDVAEYSALPRAAPPLRAPPLSRRDQVLPDRTQDRSYEDGGSRSRLGPAPVSDSMMRPPPLPDQDSLEMDDPGHFPLSPMPPPRVHPASTLSARPDDSRIPSEDMPRPVGSPLRAMRAEPHDAPDAPVDRGPRTIFDALWPDEAKKRRGLEGERNSEPVYEPADDMTPERDVSPEQARDAAQGASSSQKSAVLKSGVIEGMAYTLYTDGSIEAQMSQGVIRFGSIEELRAHLETTDSA